MAAPVYDAHSWSNIAATPAAFELKGGLYLLDAVATWGGGDVEVQKVGADGATALSLSTAMKLSADGVTAPTYLSPGQYKLTVTTATAVSAEVSRVPVN